MIDALARALAEVGLPVAADDLCAIAWLAQAMPAPAPRPAEPDASASPPPSPPGAAVPSSAPPPTLPAPTPTPAPPAPPQTTLFAAAQQGQVRAGVLRVPGVLQAPPAPLLRRALQPFTRRVPAAHRWQLDEDATAERRADTGVWELRHRRVRERWFDLQVVVDRGAGMDLWQAEVDALLRGLKSQGGFRSLQRWVMGGGGGGAGMDGGQTGGQVGGQVGGVRGAARSADVALARQPGAPPQPLAALRPPGSRPLVLLLTDGSAERWHAGAAQRWLWALADQAPVAVLQLMPRHAWRHTPLGEPVALGWWPQAGLPASALRLASDDVDDALQAGWRPVPLLAVAPTDLQRLALAVTGRGGASVPVVLFGAAHAPVRRARAGAGATTEPDGADLVARFRHKASAAAFDLAVFLSVPDPLTLPVMRLVQRCMLPASGTAELAEFFGGGLLQPLPGTPPPWRLRPGVREALRGALRLSEERHIVDQLRRVGQALENADGAAPGFEAWFPSAEGAGALSDWALPFAEASRAVLRGVGERGADAEVTPGSAALRRPVLAASRDSRQLAVAHADGRVQVWDAVRLQPTGVSIASPGDAVRFVAWGPNDLLVIATEHGALRLHHASSGELERELAADGLEPVAWAVSEGGWLLAAAGKQGHLVLWDLRRETSTRITESAGDGTAVQALCFLVDGRLAVLRPGGIVQLFRADRSGTLMRLVADARSEKLLSLGPDLMVAGAAGLQRLAPRVGKQLAVVRFDSELACIDIAREAPDGIAILEAGGRLRFWHRDSLRPFDVTVQLEPDTAALASAPDGSLFALTRGGDVLRVPRPHRDAPPAAPAMTFLSAQAVLEAVRDSGRLPDGDLVVDALRIFSTDRQQSWMVFTTRMVALVLDEDDTRRNHRLVQQVMSYDEAVPVKAWVDRQGVATVGFAKARQRWYYSRALFATPALLQEAVASRAAEARLSDATLRWKRGCTVLLLGPDGSAVAGGYWVDDRLVATAYAAVAANLRAAWRVQVQFEELFLSPWTAVMGRRDTLDARVVAWDAAANAALLQLTDIPNGLVPSPKLQLSWQAGDRWLALDVSDSVLIGGEVRPAASGVGDRDAGVLHGEALALVLQERLPSIHGDLPAHWRGVPVWSAGRVLGHLHRAEGASGALWACPAGAVYGLLMQVQARGRFFLSADPRDASWTSQVVQALKQLDNGQTLQPADARPVELPDLADVVDGCALAVLVCAQPWAESELAQREFAFLRARRRAEPAFGIVVLVRPGSPQTDALEGLPTVAVSGDRLSDDEAALLRLLAQAFTDPHGPLQAAQQLARRQAHALVLQVLERQPLGAASLRLQAQALRMLQRPAEAALLLGPWLAEHPDDTETLTQRALAWRAVWRQDRGDQGAARQAELVAARRAVEDFERLWNAEPAQWLAVGASSLWLWLGDTERSRSFAAQALAMGEAEHQGGGPVPPFLQANMAEACVLLGRIDDARAWLQRPVEGDGGDEQVVAQALRRHLAALGQDPTLLDDVLPPPPASAPA